VSHQNDVIDFLNAQLSDHGGPPTVIKTHVSVVFLSDQSAYKMKQAVKFPFLDFTTLAARKDACEKEIDINKRTAPEIYKGVVAVTQESDGLALDGPGTPIEYLVEMVRFDETQGLDQLITAPGKLRRKTMEALADQIAAFHAGADVKKDRGGYQGIRQIAENNRLSFDNLPPQFFDPEQVEDVSARTLNAIDDCKVILSRRQSVGFVLACHGDLHLRNICMFENRPTLFDAIEFSEDFSDIDTMYDLAFLLMDLDFRGERRLASFVFNRYLDLSDDGVDVYQILPIFLSMRAQIRAHVGAAAAAGQSDPSKSEKELAQARAYLTLAATYLKNDPVRLIAVGGLSGSGKTRLAREIAPMFSQCVGARVLRSDVERKRLAGVHPNQPLGPGGYTPEMTVRTFTHLFETAGKILGAGQSVVLDAVFASEAHREAALEVANDSGVEFQGLWVHASDDIRLQRINNRKNNVSDVTPDIALQQSGYDLGNMDWARIDSGGKKHVTDQSATDVLRDRFSELKQNSS
jgi:aminoglycoside phosphotransferase family enzyme/predicted kinase